MPNPVENGANSDCTISINSDYNLIDVSGTCRGSLIGETFSTAAVEANCTVVVEVALKGDIDQDNQLTLEDVIIGLQLLTGESPAGISSGGDLEGDDKLGMSELIYDLNKISE